MADDRQQRTTSHAKSVDGLVQQESALDRARSLKEEFERAQKQQGHQKQSERSKGGAQQDSQMIRDDARTLRPTPTGPMRQGPDQTAYASKLQNERAREDEKLRAAKLAQEVRARQGKSHDHDRDR